MSSLEGNQVPEEQQGRPLIEIVPEGHYRFSGTYTAAPDASPHGASRSGSHATAAPGTPHATAAPGTPHAASNITVSAPEATAGTPSGAENTERAQYRAAAPGGQAYAGQRMQGTPTGHGNVANIQHFDLPPITKETTLEVPRPEIVENVVEVPHVQYIERILEVPHVRKVPKRIQVPQMEVTERVIEIPKHVKEQSIVEVPQLQIVDHVVEVPQYITQPKIIEVAQTTLQERIIPILKRTIEEKIVEVPEDQYDRILQERVEYVTPAYGPAMPHGIPQLDDGAMLGQKGVGQPIFGPDGKPLLDATGRPLIRQPMEQKLPGPLAGDYPGGQRPGGEYTSQRPVDVVVEVPHVQHVYRNVMQPVYRHIPKPVEVPLTHYRPVPVERIIDRNVPIPVELEVVQEFLCPRIEAKYVEVPVPIPVTRVIEKPVPADAMFNSAIMEAYMKGKPPVVSACVQNCAAAGGPVIPKAKMTPSELQAAGIQSHPSFSHVKSFKSRGASFGGFNVEHSRDFLTQQRTLQREGTRRS